MSEHWVAAGDSLAGAAGRLSTRATTRTGARRPRGIVGRPCSGV